MSDSLSDYDVYSDPDDTVMQAPALARIRALLPSLPPSDARVATVVLNDPETVTVASITELAGLADTSEATVIRCCKRLGFSGYHALKIAIARESQPARRMVHDEITEDDAPETVLEKVLSASAMVIQDALSTINRAVFTQTIEELKNATSVLFVGLGPSSPLAQDAAYRFRTLGLRTDAPVDSMTQHLAARLLGADDVLVVISHTGATRITLTCVEAARATGAKVVAITSFARSPLVEAVDLALIAGGREISFRADAMASRFAHLSVLDALFVGVAFASKERSMQALGLLNDIATEHQL